MKQDQLRPVLGVAVGGLIMGSMNGTFSTFLKLRLSIYISVAIYLHYIDMC